MRDWEGLILYQRPTHLDSISIMYRRPVGVVDLNCTLVVYTCWAMVAMYHKPCALTTV